MTREEQIRTLCEKWIAQATANDSIQISSQSEQYRLMRNGIHFHELNFSELVTAGIGLTKILLLKGMNTVVASDHFHFWSWAAEVILETEDCIFSNEEHELRELFEMLIRSSLAGLRAPTNDPGYLALQQKADDLTEFNAKQLILNRSLITAYLGFPFLEGLCKKMASTYVDFSGKVIQEFSVHDKNIDRTYTVGSRCSNLGHLLYLLQDSVADRELSTCLSELYNHVEQFGHGEPGYEVIFNWRNASLHGETSFPTIGGTLVSISTLICLYQLKDKFKDKQTRIMKRLQAKYRSSAISRHRAPWEFYPPY